MAEPNPYNFERLRQKHRNAWLLPHCFSTKTTPEVVEFDADDLLGKKIIFLECRVYNTLVSNATGAIIDNEIEGLTKAETYSIFRDNR